MLNKFVYGVGWVTICIVVGLALGFGAGWLLSNAPLWADVKDLGAMS